MTAPLTLPGMEQSSRELHNSIDHSLAVLCMSLAALNSLEAEVEDFEARLNGLIKVVYGLRDVAEMGF